MKKNSVIKLADKSDNAAHVTPKEVLEEVLESYLDGVDAILVVGVVKKPETDTFGLKVTSVSKLNQMEIISVCELVKLDALESLGAKK